jgi:hypothetical protein
MNTRGRKAPFCWPLVAAVPGFSSRCKTPPIDHQAKTWPDRSRPENLAANHRQPKSVGVACAMHRGRGDRRGQAAADTARTQHSCGFTGDRPGWMRTGTAAGTGRGQRGQRKRRERRNLSLLSLRRWPLPAFFQGLATGLLRGSRLGRGGLKVCGFDLRDRSVRQIFTCGNLGRGGYSCQASAECGERRDLGRSVACPRVWGFLRLVLWRKSAAIESPRRPITRRLGAVHVIALPSRLPG